MALKSLHLLFVFLSITLMVAHLHQADAQKAPILGGYKPADPKDPHIVEIGKFAVSQHNKDANAALEFITVLKAETQVVNGINYRLSISAKDTKTGKINTYQAVVYSQPSTNTLKLVSFVQFRTSPPILGGYKPADPKNPDIVEKAKFAVSQHNKDANAALEFITVLKAETQLVSGTNYRLYISAKDTKTGKINTYQAVVYSQPWTNTLKLVSFVELVSFEELLTKPGGYAPVDPQNPDIVKIGKFAVLQHNKEANAALQFITVVKAEKQVVNGFNYRLSIFANDTKTGKIHTYQAVVYSQPKHLLKLVSFVQLPDPLLGGYAPADPRNPDIVKKGQLAVLLHNIEAHADLKFITVIEAETQVVQGMNYRLVIVAESRKTGKIGNYSAVVYVSPLYRGKV